MFPELFNACWAAYGKFQTTRAVARAGALAGSDRLRQVFERITRGRELALRVALGVLKLPDAIDRFRKRGPTTAFVRGAIGLRCEPEGRYVVVRGAALAS
jgi:hypothetical protein